MLGARSVQIPGDRKFASAYEDGGLAALVLKNSRLDAALVDSQLESGTFGKAPK